MIEITITNKKIIRKGHGHEIICGWLGLIGRAFCYSSEPSGEISWRVFASTDSENVRYRHNIMMHYDIYKHFPDIVKLTIEDCDISEITNRWTLDGWYD